MEDLEEYSSRSATTKTHTITPTHDAPCRFEGSLLAASTGDEIERAKDAKSHHLIEIYRTVGGQFVAVVTFETQMKTERRRVDAMRFDSTESMREALLSFDPTIPLYMPPIDDRQSGAQAKRERDESVRLATRDAWLRLVAAILKSIGHVRAF